MGNLEKVFSGGFLDNQTYNFTDGKKISDQNLVYIRAGLQDFDLYTDWTSFPAAVGLDTDVSLSYYVNDGAYCRRARVLASKYIFYIEQA